MALKGRIIGGYHFTPDMLKAEQRVRRAHGMSLRDYLIKWRRTNLDQPITSLAEEMGVDPTTLYRTWFVNLDLYPVHWLLPGEEYRALRQLEPATGTDG